MHAPFLIALLVLGTSGPSSAQRTYLSTTLETTSKGKAAYYKEPDGMDGTTYKARIHSLDGKLKAEGRYADAELKIPHGTFTFYHPNGKKESTGEYRMGIKAGVWQRYDEWGTALAEKVYDTKPIENLVYAYAPTMPQYPGGQKELVKYLRTKVDDVQLAAGTATATFVVEKDGKLSDVKVSTENEQVKQVIEEALAESPKWQVGEKDGVPVRVAMTVPIKY
jgi:antitoxin component YwqK of YwqJK toxin-antitoxin module